MRPILICFAAGCAAVALAATPATAQRWNDPGFSAAANVSVHRGKSSHSGGRHGDRFRSQWTDGRDRRHGDRDRDDFGFPFYAADYGYYDANRSWEPDSYNDWWHDRPNRAFPRWVQDNAGCDRQWWSGGGWRC